MSGATFVWLSSLTIVLTLHIIRDYLERTARKDISQHAKPTGIVERGE